MLKEPLHGVLPRSSKENNKQMASSSEKEVFIKTVN